MNAFAAMHIPYWIRCILAPWILVIAFVLPVPVTAVTEGGSGINWTAKRVDAEQGLAIAMANLESAQAKLSQEPEAVTPQSRSTAKLVKIREDFVNVYKAELDAVRKLENQHIALGTARQALAEWQPPVGSPPWPLTKGDAVRIALFKARESLALLSSRSEATKPPPVRRVTHGRDSRISRSC